MTFVLTCDNYYRQHKKIFSFTHQIAITTELARHSTFAGRSRFRSTISRTSLAIHTNERRLYEEEDLLTYRHSFHLFIDSESCTFRRRDVAVYGILSLMSLVILTKKKKKENVREIELLLLSSQIYPQVELAFTRSTFDRHIQSAKTQGESRFLQSTNYTKIKTSSFPIKKMFVRIINIYTLMKI
ncbi:hypothetical protein PUN28_014606 [Cardiocondyla obscurior]|uniref:Uncharacterized protein n=1 Tax=Cardiocondyla obscurior TaxID=286306 RepID=A0AAW2F152_9HYME